MMALKAGKRVDEIDHSHFWWECEMLQIVYYKTKHVITIRSSNYTLGYLSQGNENLCLHKNLFTNVHGIFMLIFQS